MPDIVKKPGWNRQFKSYDKINKRLMTGVKAAELDANNREQVAIREALQGTNIAFTASFLTGPTSFTGPPLSPPPPNEESTPDIPFCGFSVAATATITTATTTPRSVGLSSPDEEEEEEEEEAIDEAFILPPQQRQQQ